MTVRELLYGGVNPYAGIIVGDARIEGWDHTNRIFFDLLEEFRPSLIVELGSWVGGSAITMAKSASELGLDCEIVCVDHFLGSAEHLGADNKFLKGVPRSHGRPMLYERFLANVVGAWCEDRITPLLGTTTAAAEFFVANDLEPDLVYVDAGHGFREVSHDIHDWWDLKIRPRCIFGHDYSDEHKEVKIGVRNSFGFDDLDLSRQPFWIVRRESA
jgi:hypothetical protein